MTPPVLRTHKVRTDRDRVNLIFRQAWKGIQNPSVRGGAMSKVSRCRSRDDECELRSLFRHQQRNVKYMPDVTDVDTYQSPQRTIAWGGGDCDDHVSKLIAEGTALGFRMGARVIPATDDRDGHIMALAAIPRNDPKTAIVLDTTVPGAYMGWHPTGRKAAGWKDYWLVIDDDGPRAELGNTDSKSSSNKWIVAGLIAAGVIAASVLCYRAVRRSR